MGIVMIDNFEANTDGQLITDSNYYNFVAFPGVGAGSTANNPSSKWETDTGWLYCKVDSLGRHWGYSGRPIDWPDKYFFRLATRDATVADQIIEFDYKSADYGVGGYSEDGSSAVDIWLRYQTQYWLYIVQFDRVNNGIVCKRKVPTNDNGQWTGPVGHIVNKGVYYTLLTDANQPVFGAGLQFVSWTGLTSVLNSSSDFGKPGYPNLAHDGTNTGGTIYNFKMTITTVSHSPFNYTQIQLWRANKLVGSWTDKNDCLNYLSNATFQQHWDAGYYNNVTGKQAAWGFPIYAAGKSGSRADNIQIWYDNFTLSSVAVAPPTAPTVVSTSATSIAETIATINGTVNPNGSSTNGFFQWGTSPTLAGATTTSNQALGSASQPVSIHVDLTGLTASTTYYYRVAGTNAGGTTNGTILSFTTAAAPVSQAPVVSTTPATNVTKTTATLNGLVNPEGASTTSFFLYSTDPTLATGQFITSNIDSGSGSSNVNTSFNITGLTKATTYYYQISAVNATGQTSGAIVNFTTQDDPVVGVIPTVVGISGLNKVTQISF